MIKTGKADFIYDNMILEMNVIHSAWMNGCKKLEFLGSSCIYPRMAPQPMPESCLLTSSLESTNEAYALAKISGLKYCEYLNGQYGTDYIPACLSRDFFNRATQLVSAFFIPGFLPAKDPI